MSLHFSCPRYRSWTQVCFAFLITHLATNPAHAIQLNQNTTQPSNLVKVLDSQQSLKNSEPPGRVSFPAEQNLQQIEDILLKNNSLAQVPTPLDLEPLPSSVEPRSPEDIELPSFETPSEPFEALEEPESPSNSLNSLTVTEFEIIGEPTVISADELRQIPLPFPDSFFHNGTQAVEDVPSLENEDRQILDNNECIGTRSLVSLENQTLSLQQLIQTSVTVAQEYACRGYSTSGAVIEIPEETQRNGSGVVQIRVIEGVLEKLQVDYELEDSQETDQEDSENVDETVSEQPSDDQRSRWSGVNNRLSQDYVRSRLGVSESEPLNIDRLQEHLQLLQLDPLIERISAELSEGVSPGNSRLRVLFKEAASTETLFSLNNGRSPSVGTFQRQVAFNEGNSFGLGHNLNLNLTNTDGSTSVRAGYEIPLNPQDGIILLSIELTDSGVIEPPFDDIDGDGDSPDIESNSQLVELTYRQPILRRVRDGNFQELALGLTTSWRDSEITLLELPFPSPGADSDGRTRITALRFFQEWSLRNANQVLALRSQFNFGLGALGATVNEQIEGVEAIPDSRFFSWQGQAQWVRVLAQDTLLRLRADIQLADQVLLSAEQFSIGGFGSVRGYRQGVRQRDNGIFASAEVQMPVMRVPEIDGLLQVAPFVDYGMAWNVDGGRSTSDTLVSLGLGLLWQQNNTLFARLDYGVPLVPVGARSNRTLQEDGLLFSVQYRL